MTGVLMLLGLLCTAPAGPGSSATAGPWQGVPDRMPASAVPACEDGAHVSWYRLTSLLGLRQPRHIVAYRGYGNGERIWVRGRVLANREPPEAADDHDWWDNLRATLSRWNTFEVRDAPVTLRYRDQTRTVRTDHEGYYQASFPAPGDTRDAIAVHAEHAAGEHLLEATHWVMAPPARADHLIISDVDDTVLHTSITDLLLAARLTFFNNARTRTPLAGAAGLYRELAQGEDPRAANPVVYVSNSAWNLYDLIRDFLSLNGFPKGPILLRDIGFGSRSSAHKPESLRYLLERYPELPAVLIGDSGQHDASIYAELAQAYPDRVAAVYIRDIDPEEHSEYDAKVDRIIESVRDLGVPFVRVQDSVDVARHAVQIGLLPEAALTAVEVATDADRTRSAG